MLQKDAITMKTMHSEAVTLHKALNHMGTRRTACFEGSKGMPQRAHRCACGGLAMRQTEQSW